MRRKIKFVGMAIAAREIEVYVILEQWLDVKALTSRLTGMSRSRRWLTKNQKPKQPSLKGVSHPISVERELQVLTSS